MVLFVQSEWSKYEGKKLQVQYKALTRTDTNESTSQTRGKEDACQ